MSAGKPNLKRIEESELYKKLKEVVCNDPLKLKLQEIEDNCCLKCRKKFFVIKEVNR